MIPKNISPTNDEINNPLWKDTKFLLPTLSIFLLAVILPELIAWSSQPDGLIFNGTFANIPDLSVYISAIRQGAEGKWLFRNQFTQDKFPLYFAFFPYILLGKFKVLIGGTSFFWYLLFRLSSWALVIISLLKFIDVLFPNNFRLQKTSIIMMLFSSGLGWLYFANFKVINSSTPDLYIPEWNLITAAFSPPHFLLEIAFEILYFTALHKFIKSLSLKEGVLMLLTGFGISITYPYKIPVFGLILAVLLVMLLVKNRNLPRNLILSLGTISLPMIIALIYYGFILPNDKSYSQYFSNNEIFPPPVKGLLVGLGFLLPLVIIGIRSLRKNDRLIIIPIWLICQLVSIYLPIKFSGRMIIGFFIPVTILATLGLENIILPKSFKMWKIPIKFSRLSIIALTIPSTIFLVFYFLVGVSYNHKYPFFQRAEDVKAAQWLGEKTNDEDLVLANYPFNNLFPRYGKGQVLFGHFDLAIDSEIRSTLMKKFWDPQTPESWRQSFIDEWGFTYIYQGYYENALSGDVPLEFPYEVIYSTDEVTIYRLP